MKEKDKLSIEEQNKRLKIAGRILLVLVLVLTVLLAYNMVTLHGLNEIEAGDYITVEDCDRKYSLENMFDLGLEVTEDSSNGSGIE